MPTVGVLSYQGGFARHLERLDALGVSGVPVRDLASLAGVDALIIPGGESTTIGMLMERFGLLDAVRERIAGGFPVFGTCAGAILLARTILLADDGRASDQTRIGVIDMDIRRNAYGRQIESFEADVLPALGGDAAWDAAPFHGVFIRAPRISRIGDDVVPILAFEDEPVLVRSGPLLAATFHPELTQDDSVHRFFITEVAGLG